MAIWETDKKKEERERERKSSMMNTNFFYIFIRLRPCFEALIINYSFYSH